MQGNPVLTPPDLAPDIGSPRTEVIIPPISPSAMLSRRLLTVVEVLVLVLGAFFITRPLLNLDLEFMPPGSEFMGVIQINYIWTLAQQCGSCAFWFGNVMGGVPAFAEPTSSHLYPTVILFTLGWGLINGSKLALAAAFLIAGLAQWWLARVLGVGLVARLWSAGMAMTAAHMAGRLEQGMFSLIVSIAACSLAIAPLMRLSQRPAWRNTIILGLTMALALVSGHLYIQFALALTLPALLILLPWGTADVGKIVQRYLIAAILSLLLSAPLFVPVFHFLPEVAKDFDTSFRGAQRLLDVPYNLVTNDMAYYRSEVNGKLPYPSHYVNYIGWIAAAFAIVGLLGGQRAPRRAGLFLGAFTLLVFWAASAGPQTILIRLIPFESFDRLLAGPRYVSFMAALAVPAVLGLAALGVDRLLRFDWPGLNRLKLRSRLPDAVYLSLGIIWTAIVLVPLVFALQDTYSFSRRWIALNPVPPNGREMLAGLKTPDAQWVSGPYGQALWMGLGAEQGLKLARTHFWTWRWRGRPQPEPVLEASYGQPPANMTQVSTAGGARIFFAPNREYAAITGSDGSRTICHAHAQGGFIDVVCDSPVDGQLTVIENSWTGWNVWVDSQPATLVAGQNLAVRVPAGQHTIQFRYQPWDVPLGLSLFGLGMVMAGGLLWQGSREARRSRRGDSQATTNGPPVRPRTPSPVPLTTPLPAPVEAEATTPLIVPVTAPSTPLPATLITSQATGLPVPPAIPPDQVMVETPAIAAPLDTPGVEVRLAAWADRLLTARPRPASRVDIRRHWLTITGLMLTFGLALFPSLLVWQERVARNPAWVNTFRRAWDTSPFVRVFQFPHYFIAIFACTLALLVLFLFWRRAWLADTLIANPLASFSPVAIPAFQHRFSLGILTFASLGLVTVAAWGLLTRRRPGWDLAALLALFVAGWALREVPWSRALAAWQQQGSRWVSIALFHLAFLVCLASYLSGKPSTAIFLLLLGVAAVNLAVRAPRLSPVFWITHIALVLYTYAVGAWWFTAVGDEYSFHSYAQEIVERHAFSGIGERLFMGVAVYGAHPYLSSAIQALSMWLFGTDNFGWRFSSIYLAAMSIPLLYGFNRTFVQRDIALIAAVLMAASSFIMGFGKIGYNNLQALFVLALVLWAGAGAARTLRPLAFVLLGLGLGLCFYVYPAALYAIPVPLWLLLLYRPPITRRALAGWVLTAASAFALIFPLLYQPDYWQAKTAGTWAYRPELTATVNTLLKHLGTNLVYAFYSPIFIFEDSHFVVLSYMDFLSAGFMFVGLALLVGRLVNRRFALFWLGAFVGLLFLVGASHDRSFPSTTRMFMLLPWFTLFAALGLWWTLGQLRKIGVSPVLVSTLGAATLIAIIALNVYHAYPFNKARSAGRYQQLEAVWVRTAQRLFTQAGPPRTVVWINDPGSLHIPSLRNLARIYAIPVAPGQIGEIQAKGEPLPPTAQVQFQDRNTLVIISPRLNAAARTAYEQVVAATGRTACPVKNDTGQVHFTLWLPPDAANLCPLVAS